MKTKTIPAQAVADALLYATARKKIANMPRFAAYTHKGWVPACGARVGVAEGIVPIHFGAMGRGNLGALAGRVQREHGGREVARIWGVPVSALRAELAGGAL